MPTGSSPDPEASEHFPRAKGCAVLCKYGTLWFLDHLVFGLLGFFWVWDVIKAGFPCCITYVERKKERLVQVQTNP